MVKVIVGVMIFMVIAGELIAALWGTMAGTDTKIQALTQTDAGTTILQTIWPICLIVVGVGLAAGLIFWILRKVGLA